MSHLHFDLLTVTVRDLLSKSCGGANRACAHLPRAVLGSVASRITMKQYPVSQMDLFRRPQLIRLN